MHKKEIKVRKPYGYVIYAPTYRCNLKCTHCDINKISRKKDELRCKDVIDIFNNSKILKNLPISISGGEPFLYEDINKIILSLKEMGYFVGITTNGTQAEKIIDLVNSLDDYNNIHLQVSMDGYPELHDEIRRVKCGEKVWDTINYLKEVNFNYGTTTTLSKANIKYFEQIKDFFQMNDINHVFVLESMILYPEKINLFNYLSSIDNLEYFVEYFNEHDILYLVSGGNYYISNCTAGTSSAYIDPAGKVYTCLTMGAYYNNNKFLMGNLKKNNFDELWTSKEAMRAREYVKHCGGCFGPCECTKEFNIGNNSDKERVIKDYVDAPTMLYLGKKNVDIYLINWHGGENTHRWTKQNSIFFIKNDKNKKLKIKATCPIENDLIINYNTNNNLLKLKILKNIWEIYEIDLKNVADKVLKIELSSSKTWIPDKIFHNGDKRELGIAVAKIWIE